MIAEQSGDGGGGAVVTIMPDSIGQDERCVQRVVGGDDMGSLWHSVKVKLKRT